eukprot:12891755-Prorocentrum_lima.AAC.1
MPRQQWRQRRVEEMKKWTPAAVSRPAFTTATASHEVRRARCGSGGSSQHAGQCSWVMAATILKEQDKRACALAAREDD